VAPPPPAVDRFLIRDHPRSSTVGFTFPIFLSRHLSVSLQLGFSFPITRDVGNYGDPAAFCLIRGWNGIFERFSGHF
jgi:hypothetical protein